MCCWLENIKNINAHFKSLNYIHIYQGQLCADAQGQLLNLNDVQGTTPLYGCPHNSLYIPILWLNAHLCIRCPGPTPWEFPLSVCHWPRQFQGRYWLPQEWEVLGLHRLHHDLLKWGLLVPGAPPSPPPPNPLSPQTIPRKWWELSVTQTIYEAGQLLMLGTEPPPTVLPGKCTNHYATATPITQICIYANACELYTGSTQT